MSVKEGSAIYNWQWDTTVTLQPLCFYIVHSKDAAIKINHYFTVWTKLKKLDREGEKIIVLNKENEIRKKTVIQNMECCWGYASCVVACLNDLFTG